MTRCHFRGASVAGFRFNADPTAHGEKFVLTDCSFEGNEFWMESTVPADSYVIVRDVVHGDIVLQRSDLSETLDPAWNASVTSHEVS